MNIKIEMRDTEKFALNFLNELIQSYEGEDLKIEVEEFSQQGKFCYTLLHLPEKSLINFKRDSLFDKMKPEIKKVVEYLTTPPIFTGIPKSDYTDVLYPPGENTINPLPIPEMKIGIDLSNKNDSTIDTNNDNKEN